MNEPFPYADILFTPYGADFRRQRMPMADRAAQFTPFSICWPLLTGEPSTLFTDPHTLPPALRQGGEAAFSAGQLLRR